MRTKKPQKSQEHRATMVAPRHTSEDIELESRIANFLHQQHASDGADIHADARHGTVVLSGKLPSRHAKWLCVECCRRVAGVIKLIDQVGVEAEQRGQLLAGNWPV